MEKPEKVAKLKTRQKFSALDVRAEVAQISGSLQGTKVHNIYDANSKTYILKLTKSGVRLNLLIESGVRFHFLENFPEKNDKPNGFAMKLRKHLRGLFFDSIEQLGVERVVRFKFCGADTTNINFIYYLVVELYAKGNILLLDSAGVIIALLRIHTFDEQNKSGPKLPYPVQLAAKFYFENIKVDEEALNILLADPGQTVSQLVSKLVPCAHQSLIDLFVANNNLSPNAKYQPQMKDKLLLCAGEILKLYDPNASVSKKGFCYFQTSPEKPFEFSPVPLDYSKVNKNVQQKEFPTFDNAVQHFFSQFKAEDNEQAQHEKIEKEALKKFAKIREDQDRRLLSIQEEIILNGRKAEAIELASTEISALFNVT